MDAAVSDRQAEAASRSAKLRDAQTQAAAADARLQTVSVCFPSLLSLTMTYVLPRLTSMGVTALSHTLCEPIPFDVSTY